MIKKLFWYISWNIRGKSDKAISGVGRNDFNQEQLEELAIKVMGNLDLGNDDILLDIGCAQGFMTNMFSQKIKKATGIDISSSSIKKAKSLYNSNTKIDFFKCKDEPPYDFENEEFSKIICLDVVQYFTNDNQFDNLCSEIYRVLKHQGKALIGSIKIKKNRSKRIDQQYTTSVGIKINKEIAYLLHRTYSEDYLYAIAEKYKFKEIKLTRSEYFPDYSTVDLILIK